MAKAVYRSPGARTKEELIAERGDIESQHIDPQAPKESLIDQAISNEINKDPEYTEAAPAAPVEAPIRTRGVGQGDVAQISQTPGGPTRDTADPIFNDEGPVEEDRPLFDAQGQELTRKQKLDQQVADKKKAEEYLQATKSLGAVDLTSRDSIGANLSNVVLDSDRGQVQSTAKNVIDGLTEITVSTPNVNQSSDVTAEGQTGLDLIKQQTGLDTRQVPTAVITSLGSLAQELLGQTNNDSDQTVAVNESQADDPFASLADVDTSADARGEVRALPKEIFGARFASYMKQYLQNQAAAQGIDPKSVRLNSDILAALGTDIATRNNSIFKFAKDYKGNDVVAFGEKGIDFGRSVKEFSNVATGKNNKFAFTAPVNANTGWLNNAIKHVRDPYLKKGTKDHQRRQKPEQIIKYQAVLGSGGYTTTTGQVGGLALLSVLANKLGGEFEGEKAKDFIGIGEKRKAQIRKNAANPDVQEDRVIAQTLEELVSSVNTFTGIKNANQPQYNPARVDPTSLRSYGENRGVEIQNNIFNRNLANDNQSVHIKTDTTSLDRLTKLKPKDVLAYFDRHEGDGGNTQDRSMQLVEELIIAHRNIVGKPTENMLWEQRYNEATNPAFYNNAAKTGALIQSAINKLGILNDDGSINTDVLSSTLPTLDQNGKVPKDSNNNFKSVVEVQAELPNLTEPEREAIREWLRNSNKKNYGFRLSSYLSLADLKNVVANPAGGHWKPKQMGEMDMNSAGRSFIANDLGDSITLGSTGILVDQFLDANNPEVFSMGGPRAYFRKKAMDILKNPRSVAKIFNNSTEAVSARHREEIAQAFNNVVNEILGQPDQVGDFEDSFAKMVQLTDDYTLPAAFHQSDADAFLQDYPQIEEALIDFYGDRRELVSDIASLYENTLLSSNSAWNSSLVKNSVRFLQHFGEHPDYVGMYGEPSHIGSEALREIDDDAVLVIKGSKGEPVEIKAKEFKKDFLGRKQSKELTDWKTGKKFHHDYNEGSLIVNQMGPILGQRRESYVLIGIANALNPDITKPVTFMGSVHDNIVTSGRSWLKMYRAANRPGGVVDKVFDFNHTEAFLDNMKDQKDSKIIDKLRQAHKKGEKFNIGRAGDHSYVMTEADNIWKKLNDPKVQLTEGNKEYYEDMIKIYKTVGWLPPAQRGTVPTLTHEIDPINWTKPVEITLRDKEGKKYKKSYQAYKALIAKYSIETNLDRFKNLSEERADINKKRRADGNKSFIS